MVVCWRPLIECVVDADQLALTDGPPDKCHAGNVKPSQFYMVALLVGPRGAGSLLRVRVLCTC